MPNEEMQRSGLAHRMWLEEQDRRLWRACMAVAWLLYGACPRTPDASDVPNGFQGEER